MAYRIRECEVVYRNRPTTSPVRSITSSLDVYRLLPEYADRAHESLVVILLDSRNRVVAVHEAARGGISQCSVDPGQVFRAAIVAGVERIILAHNHPSGVAEPSAEDSALTQKLMDGAALLGIHILDHVIIAGAGYFSMLDAGLLRPRTQN